MAKLQRYTSFEKLKSAAHPKKRVAISVADKSSELEDFIVLLRSNLSPVKEKVADEKRANR